MNPNAPTCRPFSALPWRARADGLALGGAAAALAVHLWPAWRQDDNLSHGPLLPVLVAILLFESRRDPRPRFLRPGAGPLATRVIALGAAAAFLGAATIYAAAVGWSHAIVDFLLTAAFVLAAASTWLGYADVRARILPLNWAAGVAVGLGLFAAPTPPGTYARVAVFLQGVVTAGVVGLLRASGIAAYRDGNLIELARTSVGISEACSGVRSLVSCAVAGLFLSATLVRRPAHRLLVVALAPAIGLAMNFVRSLLLTLLANAGVAIEGRWHDLTGGAIIVVTTLLVAGVAIVLHRREGTPPASVPPDGTAASGPPLAGLAALTLLVALGGAGFLAARTRPVPEALGPGPNLAGLFPLPPAGWTAETPTDLDQFSEVLHTHALAERVYLSDPQLKGPHFTLYLAYWRAGQAPVSLVDAHTPDACWPGTGWTQRAVPEARAPVAVGGRTLAPAECRLFVHGEFETRVWYWHLYGGRPLAVVDPYSVARLLKVTLRYGFGQPQDQLFVRVSGNRPWDEIASLPAVRQFFERLQPLGL